MYTDTVLLAAVMGAMAGLTAQTPGWDKLNSIAPGQRVGIITADRNLIRGRFQSWSPSSIAIVRGRRVQSFATTDVRTVELQQKGSRWKGAMWGAIIGFAAIFPCGAASAGYVADTNHPSNGTRIGVGAAAGMFGAGIGAAIGALAGGTKSVTIYRARGTR